MSAKWVRVRAADDEIFKGPLGAPVKWVLRALSSITLAVILLSMVMAYGILASVPIGLLALTPTYAAVALTLIATVAAVAGIPVFALHKITRGGWRANPVLFAGVFAGGLALSGVAVFFWRSFLWPVLMYDPARRTGLRFFASFVEQYDAITIRRMPGMEMSELEFYSWWPLRVILLVFVLNMIVATVRRIEFNFRNIGVLTVHTGIIIISLGSVYYSGLKREGDTILFAGRLDPASGVPAVGPAQNAFYDNTRTALYIDAGKGWEQRPLTGVPRYNDYNLGASPGVSAWERAQPDGVPWLTGVKRNLSLSVPDAPVDQYTDIHARVVGYCAFADRHRDWIKAELTATEPPMPVRIVTLHTQLADTQGRVTDEPRRGYVFAPASPLDRVVDEQGAFAIEYTMGEGFGMSAQRWQDLSEPLPDGTEHALVVEVPARGTSPAFRAVYPVRKGVSTEVGQTGYRLTVKDLSPTPPFPIITEGYKGANSSVAIVTINSPGSGAGPETFDRYVYHRFPQINQDMLAKTNERGMPVRRDADPGIRIALIEADMLNVYFDDRPDGTGRAIVRQRGGQVRVLNELEGDGRVTEVVEKVSLKVAERWMHARAFERPSPASPEEIRKDRQALGAHDKAMLAVEVRVGEGSAAPTTIAWVPSSKYLGVGSDGERNVQLGGRSIDLAFGRLQHHLPGFAVQLVDFRMISYDHRGAPRDYQSTLKVTPEDNTFEQFEHVTQLNSPLTAPFSWDDGRNYFVNLAGRIRAGLDPSQFKFSQAGWDASGWARTQAQVDAGVLKKPFASYTILGVGNSPGIHVIALGGVLMGMGIPWAFYVKPWLVQREKRRIQEQVKAGTYVAPKRRQKAEPSPQGVET